MYKSFVMMDAMIALIATVILSGVMNRIIVTLDKIQVRTRDVQQNELFEVQFRQLMNRSNNHECHENKVYFSYDSKQFLVENHRERIVKMPGYEILLEDVKSMICMDSELFYDYRGKNYSFKIW